MYRYLGVQLVQEVHELPTCNFHFVFQRQLSGLLNANRSYLSEMEEVTFWVFEHILGALLGPCQALRMLSLQSPCFYHTSNTVFWAQRKSLQLTLHQWCEAREKQIKVSQFENCTWTYMHVQYTNTMLQKQSFECTRVFIFKREKIRRLEYALFLLVLWRLGVKTGRHGDPRVVPGHLGCSCIQFLLNIIDDHLCFLFTLASWSNHQQGSKRRKSRYFVSNWSIIGVVWNYWSIL